ncbi:putative general stress protein 26 [Fictibacillus macauensis ZFHKF-1]|uniref:Putative general stress protein 26 n=1 Tax=Fictibacillus macauensis ZFHKF-1 TaxID=1196324 RepID=I8AGY7_9BACL|nr:pyridoxamine 5'-phosphate oxidase family protein [Fictibacillus macauensis]EIT84689.1 putative general stress protein 26 [Fictibacillus macauensis ZFHKF-1]
MNEQAFKDQIKQIIDTNPIGTLSTVSQNKPHSRYMTFWREENQTTLLTATSSETHKVDEIEENPHVHVLLGYEKITDPYIEMQGTVTIRDDKALKHKMWNEKMEHWFSGPDDPTYILLEITPTVYRLMNSSEKEPVTVKM